MLRTTCRVNAFVAAGLHLGTTWLGLLRSRDSCGSGDGVDRILGEPSEVRYPGGWSSSPNNDTCSSRSAPFSHRDCLDSVHLLNLLMIHFPASRPGSRRCFFSACVSSRKSIPITTPNATITVHTRFGRRYGKRSQMEPGWKMLG